MVLKTFMAIFLIFSIVCGCIIQGVAAADYHSNHLLEPTGVAKDFIYNDNKFDFKFTPSKNASGAINNYNVTVSRKDNTFNKYPVQIIYQINIKDASHKARLITKYAYLEEEQDSVTETETLNTKEEFLYPANYGIKFPPTHDINYRTTDFSIRDSLFNLEIYYNYWWITDSGIYYKFINRKNINLNCPVTLKRAITLNFEGSKETKWLTVNDKFFDSWKRWIFDYDRKFFGDDLKSFETTADDYYLQFQ